jgi:ABC-2 type transport system permease protein
VSRAVRVARQDFENAARSYVLGGVVAVFAILGLVVAVLPGLISRGSFTGAAVVWFLTVLSGVLVPLIAVVATYLAVAGERETGTLKILLSLPPRRVDVVAGKFLGRSAVVLTSVLVALVLSALASLVVYGSLPVGPYLVAVGLTALLGVCFVGVTIGLSAATSTRQRAMATTVGFYVLFVAFWDLVIQALQFFLDLGLSIRLSADAITFLTVVSPGKAYGRLVNTLVVPDLLAGSVVEAIAATPVDPAGGPVYLQTWVVVLVVLIWTVVPVVAGYWRFEGADLG